ncbi:hypothetical protein CEV32_1583 [Brucella rhizosphaerae]|uniref:Uncharacterized protein n=1 Tax=Brucella rhizosphaerae TaxID=571254 RepID=A0A256F8T9_9HYPH|nr:hypothetical protein CEV32_1583 [Brucella rhizosphaerae]
MLELGRNCSWMTSSSGSPVLTARLSKNWKRKTKDIPALRRTIE